MTVLIAAAGEPGEAAAGALANRDVRRVETVADAGEVVGDATVVVVGTLSEGSPADVCEAARAAGVPVVSLTDVGSDDPEADEMPVTPGTPGTGYDATAPPGDTGALRDAVGLAERVGEYRDAVDLLYEQCRARTEGDEDPDLREARTRAHHRFHELRDAAGHTPYAQVFRDRLQDAEKAVPDDRKATEDDEVQE